MLRVVFDSRNPPRGQAADRANAEAPAPTDGATGDAEVVVPHDDADDSGPADGGSDFV